MLMDEKSRRFFRPVWRRILVIALLAVWTTVEWLSSNPFWAVLTTGALGISLWMFVFDYRHKDSTSPDN